MVSKGLKDYSKPKQIFFKNCKLCLMNMKNKDLLPQEITVLGNKKLYQLFHYIGEEGSCQNIGELCLHELLPIHICYICYFLLCPDNSLPNMLITNSNIAVVVLPIQLCLTLGDFIGKCSPCYPAKHSFFQMLDVHLCIIYDGI